MTHHGDRRTPGSDPHLLLVKELIEKKCFSVWNADSGFIQL
jgi:hypothetical protein